MHKRSLAPGPLGMLEHIFNLQQHTGETGRNELLISLCFPLINILHTRQAQLRLFKFLVFQWWIKLLYHMLSESLLYL